MMRYSANASSDHQPSQVPGTLKTINPKQPTLPICSIISTALLFQLFSKPSLHLTAKTMFGIIITTMKTKPNTLNHSIRVSPQILICHSLFPQKRWKALNNSPKFHNSLLNLLFQLFSIKIVSFREIRYIKIARIHCFQWFCIRNIFVTVIPTQSLQAVLMKYHRSNG